MRRILGMLVKKISPVGKQFMFLAYRQYLWIGATQDHFNNSSDEIASMILEDHPWSAELELDAHESSGDLFGFINDRVRDAVMGQYDRETRTIWMHGSEHSVRTSPLVKKVVETLGARTVSYETPDEKTYNVKRVKIRGDWDWKMDFYHGTSTKYFEPIVRLGIRPIPGQTNYTVQHDDLIFLTSRFDEARHHAFHTAKGGSQAQRAWGYSRRLPTSLGLPMVVVTKVPAPQRIVPDFDVDSWATRSKYEHSGSQEQYFSVGSEKASKHAGLFGYAGRIPSKFFTMILVWAPAGGKWLRVVPGDFSKVIRGIDNYGDEFWTNRYGTLEEERSY